MDIIYRSLVKRIKMQIPEIRWIDLDGGQLEFLDESYPVQFPAVFIDFRNIQYQQLSRNYQQGTVSIGVRVAFNIYEDFHGDSPDIEQAADRLKLLNKVYVALHGFSGLILTDGEDNHYSKLQRQSMQSERRSDGLKVYEITFQCAVRDKQAQPVYVQHQLTDIEVQNDNSINNT